MLQAGDFVFVVRDANDTMWNRNAIPWKLPWVRGGSPLRLQIRQHPFDSDRPPCYTGFSTQTLTHPKDRRSPRRR